MLGPVHRTTPAIAGNTLKRYRLTWQARLPNFAWINWIPTPEHRRLIHNVDRNRDAGIRHCLHGILSCLPAINPVQRPPCIVPGATEAIVACTDDVKAVGSRPRNP